MMKTLNRALRAIFSVVLVFSAVFSGATFGAHIDAATLARLNDKAAKGESVKLIVRLKGEASASAPTTGLRASLRSAIALKQQKLLAKYGGRFKAIKRFRETPYVAFETDSTGLAALLAENEVERIEEDLPFKLTLNDTPAITGVNQAWSSGYRGAGQAVAILDTGVDTAHPFFSGKIAAEACFSHNSSSTYSLCPNGQDSQTGAGAGKNCGDTTMGCWHGTHVAGIAAGKSGILTGAGMAPDAKIVAIQVFTRSCEAGGSCSLLAYSSDIGAALDHVFQLSATLPIASVNLSLGGGSYSAACDDQVPSLKELIDTLRNANIATVVASGNNGASNAINLPACISSAISVGSTTKQNAVASYSNSAAQLALLAPGSGIYSSMTGGGFGTASGTSMATPHVAGIWAVMKAAKPTATVSEILAALQATGVGITDSRNGLVRPLVQVGGSTGALANLIGVANQPPTVNLASPTNNATFTAPATITLSANATDADGSVSKVEFYNGASLIGTDTNGGDGWSVSWASVPAGSYTLSAKAYDNVGATTNSAAVSLGVSAPGALPSLGLVAHYAFDETSGTTAGDASGYNNHASVLNGATWVAGRVGGALSFDGSNDGLNLNNLAGLSAGNTPHTIAAWVKVNSLPANRAWMLLLGNEGVGAHHWLLNANGIGQLGSWAGNQAQPTLPTGVWKHLTLTFDGATLKAYLDGSLITTTSASFNLSGLPLTGALQHINENFFNGALDELRIYNRALSVSEVASLATQ